MHEQRGKSRLCFWRLQFLPTYGEAVLEELPRLLETIGIVAYNIYETFGSYDVVVRCWVPTSMRLDHVAAQLDAVLLERDLYASDYFEVSEVLRHWSWADDGSLRPAAEALLNGLTDEQLTAADHEKAALRARESKFLEGASDLPRLISHSIVRPLESSGGVRFLLVLTTPLAPVPSVARTRLHQDVLRACSDFESRGLTDWSVYSGHGFGWLVVMARVAFENFYPVVRELVNRIGGNSFIQHYKMRTFTAVVTTAEFVHFSDRLALVATSPDADGLAELAVMPESERLELKTTAFADIGAMLLGDAAAPPKLDALTDAVRKTVCAFLNSPSGGTILLGVLEHDDFVSRHSSVEGLRERLVGEFGPTLGSGSDRLAIGIEYDYVAVRADGWDQYTRRLLDALQRRLTPNCAPWISFRREVVAERTIAAIDVSSMSIGWAYTTEVVDNRTVHRFWVREYGVTKEYAGPEADAYKLTGARGGTADG